MRKHIFLFFLALIFFAACKWDSKPPGVLNRDKMISVLTAVHLVDGSIYNVYQTPDSLYKYGSAKYTSLFKRFHTDSAQFNKSVKYYCLHPDELQIMYDQILKTLQFKRDSLNNIIIKQNLKNAVPKK